MIATNKPSRNQYFTNSAHVVVLIVDNSGFFSVNVVADVTEGGAFLRSIDGDIVTALAIDDVAFIRDSFMANLYSPKNNEGEEDDGILSKEKKREISFFEKKII